MVIRDVTYGVEATARCVTREGHAAPADGCRCGFNAWHDIASAYEYFYKWRRPREGGPQPRAGNVRVVNSVALLRVALSGHVIEGTLDVRTLNEWGYRASSQRVTDVFFETKCAFCAEPAVGLGVAQTKFTLPETNLCQLVRPTCPNHQIRTILQPKDLMEHNDVGVHWGYPSE